MLLEKQVIVVAGGGRGMGRAAALACAQEGGTVIPVARTTEEVEETARAAREAGGQALALPADIADYQAVAALVERILEEFGRLDALINTAGIIQPVKPVWETDPQRWAYNLSVNLVGAFHLTHAVLPTMIEAGRGRLIHVSSGAATHPVDAWSAYCAAKAGLDHFVRTAAADLVAYDQIAIYSVYPGVVDTEMQAFIRQVPAEDFGEENRERYRRYKRRGILRPPEEPARLMLYLATMADPADSGAVYNIDDPSVQNEVREALGGEPFQQRR